MFLYSYLCSIRLCILPQNLHSMTHEVLISFLTITHFPPINTVHCYVIVRFFYNLAQIAPTRSLSSFFVDDIQCESIVHKDKPHKNIRIQRTVIMPHHFPPPPLSKTHQILNKKTYSHILEYTYH